MTRKPGMTVAAHNRCDRCGGNGPLIKSNINSQMLCRLCSMHEPKVEGREEECRGKVE